VTFLEAAVAYYAKLGIRIEHVMTDNGSCYRSKAFRAACKRLGLRQIFTRPYTPKTNGKAERFIQTSLRMGLRAGLQLITRTHCRIAALAASLPLASPSWQLRIKPTHQPTRPDREQPIEPPQLANT
jgi:transposase InsO family protein